MNSKQQLIDLYGMNSDAAAEIALKNDKELTEFNKLVAEVKKDLSKKIEDGKRKAKAERLMK